MMIRIFVIIITLVSFSSAFSQQHPFFSQYYINDMVINPAISGSKTFNPLIIHTRQQWLGFEGAPLTTNISYHGAVNERSALGGYLMFDKAFPSLQANVHLNYAYHIPLDYEKINLSFGLGAKMMYHSLDFNKGDLPPVQDEAFSNNAYEKYLGDASSGVYLYGQNFYTGFSINNLFQSSFNTEVSGSPYTNSEYRNYYGMGAYRFNILNNDWQLEPSLVIRKMQYQRAITDFTTRILYLENNWAGITYRTNGTAIFVFGFGLDNLHLSYSYDYTFSGDIMQYNYGTHELGICFKIKTNSSQRHIGFWSY